MTIGAPHRYAKAAVMAAALLAQPVAANAGGGGADASGAYYDRSFVLAANDKCRLFAPTVASCLMTVEPRGGEPRPVTVLDAVNHEVTHRFPSFLPDGQHFLFLATGDANDSENDVAVGSLGSTTRTPLFKGSRAPVYAEPVNRSDFGSNLCAAILSPLAKIR